MDFVKKIFKKMYPQEYRIQTRMEELFAIHSSRQILIF